MELESLRDRLFAANQQNGSRRLVDKRVPNEDNRTVRICSQ